MLFDFGLCTRGRYQHQPTSVSDSNPDRNSPFSRVSPLLPGYPFAANASFASVLHRIVGERGDSETYVNGLVWLDTSHEKYLLAHR